jgi:pimeloyl-ACP methyl ester carboxylesterase
MSVPHCHAVWDAPDRQSALAATDAHGEGGSKMRGGGISEALAPSDELLFHDRKWMQKTMAIFPETFAQGLEGYTDDRLADGVGWVTFDVAAITSPVTILHGGRDRMCSPVNAFHTAEIVPNARLDLYEDLGHFSIETKLITTIRDLLAC